MEKIMEITKVSVKINTTRKVIRERLGAINKAILDTDIPTGIVVAKFIGAIPSGEYGEYETRCHLKIGRKYGLYITGTGDCQCEVLSWDNVPGSLLRAAAEALPGLITNLQTALGDEESSLHKALSEILK